jgi:transposase
VTSPRRCWSGGRPGRSKSEVAREYGMSRVWVQKLVHRYEREGLDDGENGRTITSRDAENA